MAFSIYCIFESVILVANAIAILNDRFLIPMGLNIERLNKPSQNPSSPATVPDSQKPDEPEVSMMEGRGQAIMLIHTFRKYMRCK